MPRKRATVEQSPAEFVRVPALVGRLAEAQVLLERLAGVITAEELAALKADVTTWLEG